MKRADKRKRKDKETDDEDYDVQEEERGKGKGGSSKRAPPEIDYSTKFDVYLQNQLIIHAKSKFDDVKLSEVTAFFHNKNKQGPQLCHMFLNHLLQLRS